ncbi:hypothetical protein [Virgisporangium ochraceum]|uniref:Peptidase M10 metallopeptidase domain-containing protein n=1 Tax=Virgisporangium ochraceum TaxID=65505 RepID=A0A8J4EBZ2_9ACTN|nr:hypothetical protein [Virgisporangium ochraceum]GIJ69910.1 hypothetical protein Voc01_048270 [Virgisporangium ochraceum]
MNRRGLLLPTAVALVAAAALVGVSPSVAPGVACPSVSGVVPASALASPVPARACDLAGAVVGAGSLAVRVPLKDGESVTAAGSARTGHPATLTVERFSGAVRARIWQSDTAPAPKPRPPVARMGSVSPPPPTEATTATTTVRCGDGAGAWLGMRWQGAYRWMMRPAGMPGYLGAFGPVRDAVRNAATAVDRGHNSCGIVGDLALSQRYSGETTRDAGINADGTCGDRDERNVVAFGRLDGGLLALTCLWWSRGRTVESDVRISDAPGMFTLDPAAGCSGSWDLQGTLTHEFGHVFGLGHVAYAEHGELTMSDGLPACSAGFRSLGLGDYETLRGQYGTT